MELELDYLMYILKLRIMEGKVHDGERSWCTAALKQPGLMMMMMTGSLEEGAGCSVFLSFHLRIAAPLHLIVCTKLQAPQVHWAAQSWSLPVERWSNESSAHRECFQTQQLNNTPHRLPFFLNNVFIKAILILIFEVRCQYWCGGVTTSWSSWL